MAALGAGPRGVPAAAAFQRQRGRPGPPVPAVTGLRRALQAEAGFASCVTQEREQKFPDERPGLLPPWPHGACYSACPSRGARAWRGRMPPLLPSLAPLLPCSEASPSGGPPAGHRHCPPSCELSDSYVQRALLLLHFLPLHFFVLRVSHHRLGHEQIFIACPLWG